MSDVNWANVVSCVAVEGGCEVVERGSDGTLGEVRRVAGDGMVGANRITTYIFVAYKGTKVLKQWGQTVTTSGAWTMPVTGGGSTGPMLPSLENMAKKHWPEAVKLGADRLCVQYAYPLYSKGQPWLCYNGYSFSEGLTLPSCPSGQVWDSVQWKCVPAMMFQPGMTFDFKTPVPTASKGLQPQQQFTQPSLDTSFLRPQRVAGFDWSGVVGAVATDEGLRVTRREADGTLGVVLLAGD